MLNYIERSKKHKNKTAIVNHQQSYTFKNFLNDSTSISSHFLRDESDLKEQKVVVMVKPRFNNVATQWGIWRAGRLTVSFSHPLSSLKYVIEDVDVPIIIISNKYIN